MSIISTSFAAIAADIGGQPASSRARVSSTETNNAITTPHQAAQ
jgi:hypothetical protein